MNGTKSGKASLIFYQFTFQYGEMETILGDIDRARAIYELAINQSLLDMPEVCKNNGYFLRDVPWEDIFKLSASAPAREFYGWVQVGIDVYIAHR